jgi:hypothetical protein
MLAMHNNIAVIGNPGNHSPHIPGMVAGVLMRIRGGTVIRHKAFLAKTVRINIPQPVVTQPILHVHSTHSWVKGPIPLRPGESTMKRCYNLFL